MPVPGTFNCGTCTPINVNNPKSLVSLYAGSCRQINESGEKFENPAEADTHCVKKSDIFCVDPFIEDRDRIQIDAFCRISVSGNIPRNSIIENGQLFSKCCRISDRREDTAFFDEWLHIDQTDRSIVEIGVYSEIISSDSPHDCWNNIQKIIPPHLFYFSSEDSSMQ